MAVVRIDIPSSLSGPIDLSSHTNMIDRIMASNAPACGAAQLTRVGLQSPMRRAVAETEATSIDSDDPDSPDPLGEASPVTARTIPPFLKARFTGHTGGVSQEYSDRDEHAHDEHAHPECGSSLDAGCPLRSGRLARAIWRGPMVAAAMGETHGDGRAGNDAADFKFTRIVARRESETLLDCDLVGAGTARWRRLGIELVPSSSAAQLP
jgi:hypothetical protein